MEEKEKVYTQKEVDKLLEGKIEIKDFNRISKQLEAKEQEVQILKKMPIIKDEYNKLGGKEEIYPDWFNKHKEELLVLEEKGLSKGVKKTIQSTAYAFAKDGAQPEQLNQAVSNDEADKQLLI